MCEIYCCDCIYHDYHYSSYCSNKETMVDKVIPKTAIDPEWAYKDKRLCSELNANNDCKYFDTGKSPWEYVIDVIKRRFRKCKV